MKGMEYQDRTGLDPAELIESPLWVMQQKMDGTRALVNLETLQFSQRNGNPLKHTAATQWIPKILQDLSDIGLSGQANTILDCELMIESGALYVFDVIDPWRLHAPLEERLIELGTLPTGKHVRPVTTARSSEEKRRLIAACEDREGVVAKLRSAPYEPGKRVDHVLKLKNVHTADVVVTRRSTSPLSAGLGVTLDNGETATIANASLIGKEKHGTIRPGDVVEVSYLAWTGVSLLQPRIMRKRDDKAAVDCRMDQFTPYSRETV